MPGTRSAANPAATAVRLASLGIVVAAVAAAVLAGRGKGAEPPPPARLLERPGRSTDLLCDLETRLGRKPPRREAKLAAACPDAAPGSSARVVPVGDDRRRSLVLPAGQALEAEVDPGGARAFRFSVATRGQGDELEVRIALGDAVWERTLATHEGWVDGEIAIAPGAGRLRLEVTASAPRERDRDARLALAAPRLIRPPRPEERGAPNVVVYLIDTLRADHTPMYGYHRDTMPRLDRLARDGIVFERAYSTAARTRPATASVLTGLYPSRHHARLGRGIAFHEETLAEKLREAGWSTWAFVANGNVFASGYAFEQGFDHFRTIRGKRHDNHARTGEINEVMLPLVERLSDEPFFLYVHAIDPHSPYDPPEEFAGAFRDPAYDGDVSPQETKSNVLAKVAKTEEDRAFVRDLYDEDILYQDAMLGELVDTLDEAGVLDRTVILVVSDHGDEFHDHGAWEHGNRLFEEQIRVPFVLRLPGDAAAGGRRIDAPVSLADVTPTLLGLYGIAPPEDAQGRDLSALILDGSSASDPGRIYAEEATNIPGGDLRTLIEGRWKLIRRASSERDDDHTVYELFDLSTDPGEKIDRSAEEPERVERMRERLMRESRRLGTPVEEHGEDVRLDARTRRQLRALGYVAGD